VNELKKEQSYWDREVAVKDSTKEIGNLVKRAEIALECAKKLQAEGSSNDSA